MGGDGFDYAMFGSAASAVRVFLAVPSISLGEALGDSFFSIEGLSGSIFNDGLFGNGADNVILGGAGNDSLGGGDGADIVNGDADNDSVTGGAGNDVLSGGAGQDTLSGGTGSDTFIFGVGDGMDTVTDMYTDVGFGATPIDRIQLSIALGVSSFDEVLAHAQQVGGSTVITFDPNTSLELVGTHILSLSADNFLFV